MIVRFGAMRAVETPRCFVLLMIGLVLMMIYFSIITSNMWTLSKSNSDHDPVGQTGLEESQQSFRYPNGVFDDTAEGAAKVTQVSMQFGDHFDLVYERALRTHIENGRKWGYPTHFLRQNIIGQEEGSQGESVYNKLLYLQTIIVNEIVKPFGKRSEWIVWFDADTVLTNNEIPWTTFLPPSNTTFQDIDLLITADGLGFNAGIFLIRVCEWSINLLSDAIALPRLKADIDLGLKEQSALRDRFDTPDRRSHRLYLPQHWFNPYDLFYQGKGEQVMSGTMVIHFPGLSHEMRAESMGLWLDKLDRAPQDLRIPLVNTSYPAETNAFWTHIGAAMDMLMESSKLKNEARDLHVYHDSHIFDDLNEAKEELLRAMEGETFSESIIRAKTIILKGEIDKTQAKLFDAGKRNDNVGLA